MVQRQVKYKIADQSLSLSNPDNLVLPDAEKPATGHADPYIVVRIFKNGSHEFVVGFVVKANGGKVVAVVKNHPAAVASKNHSPAPVFINAKDPFHHKINVRMKRSEMPSSRGVVFKISDAVAQSPEPDPAAAVFKQRINDRAAFVFRQTFNRSKMDAIVPRSPTRSAEPDKPLAVLQNRVYLGLRQAVGYGIILNLQLLSVTWNNSEKPDGP